MTAGDSKAAMTITQPALVSSPQSRPAPTRRALPSKLAAQRGQNWTPIQGQICKPIDIWDRRAIVRARWPTRDCLLSDIYRSKRNCPLDERKLGTVRRRRLE